MRSPAAALVSFVLLAIGCGPAGGPKSGVLSVAEEQTARGTDTRSDRTSDDTKPEGCPEPTLASIRETIFLEKCATTGCHAGETPRAGLDLSLELDALTARLSAAATQSPSGMPLVTPGQPASSYLYLKIFLETPLVGARMPKDGELSPCEIEAIRAFVEG